MVFQKIEPGNYFGSYVLVFTIRLLDDSRVVGTLSGNDNIAPPGSRQRIDSAPMPAALEAASEIARKMRCDVIGIYDLEDQWQSDWGRLEPISALSPR